MSPHPFCPFPFQSPDQKVGQVVATYLETFATITRARHLPPHDMEIPQAVHRLATCLAQPFTPDETRRILAHPKIRTRQHKMWKAIQVAEGALERFYSATVSPHNLHHFPHYEAYHDLVSAELGQLEGPLTTDITAPHQSLAFVGAGPFPISAILFHEKTGLPVTCLESDNYAVGFGEKFLARCGIAPSDIHYRHEPSGNFDFTHHPVALLSTHTPNKKQVLHQIKMNGTTEHLGVRSSTGLFGLLYEPLRSQLDGDLYLQFNKRTQTTERAFKTTFFITDAAESQIFEKEEPKPERADVCYFSPSSMMDFDHD